MTGQIAGVIAVVGMACRYPGAADIGGYWDLLRSGTETITHFDRDQLVARGADPAQVRDPDFVPARGVMPGARGFDWRFFGYSRAEAASIDPQQRVFLQCASAAIDDAGIDPARFRGRIGVYAGADKVYAGTGGPLGELAQAIGAEKDFLATRVAYKLGLRGPAVTVQTACSTSLVAVHQAAQSLRCGECDVALAGGVTILPDSDWGYRFEQGGILSPDGHCRPFDEQGAGTVPSEGVGVVMLKRLADAVRDDDRIAAVILGSAINNDGADKIGFTAPSIAGQSEVIQFAQQVAGIDPADIGYVEAHGTATRLGDPVELQALADAFGAASGPSRCWLGAVKSNMGHTGAAAGVAGLIKTALMLEHGEMVPTLHFRKPNPLLELEATPFRVCAATRPWPPGGDRFAAVSSFGIGGTNAHVVLGGAPQREPATASGKRVLVLSAKSAGALEQLRSGVARHLAEHPEVPIASIARTLAGRRQFAYRQAFVEPDPAEAARAMGNARDVTEPRALGKVAFLFPGQGTLRGAAGAPAYRVLPEFRRHFDEVRDTAQAKFKVDLSPVIDGTILSRDWFTDTVHQQLGLFALGWALGRQLAQWGITPAVMLGNSIGEYAAAALGGVWTVGDAVTLVWQRACAMRDTEPGRMAAIRASVTEVEKRLEPHGKVTIAVAAPGSVVIAGARQPFDELLASGALGDLDARPLEVARAFHSPAMDRAVDVMRDAAAVVSSRPSRLRLISGMTGDQADPLDLTDPDYWARHLRRPVVLADAMGTLLGSGCGTFVELGPGTSMIAALRRVDGWDDRYAAIPMLGGTGDEERGLLSALGTLWEHGADIPIADLLSPDRAVPCSLPGHPFTEDAPQTGPESPVRERPRAADDRPSAPARASAGTPGLRAELERLWCEALGVSSAADADDFFVHGGESLTAVGLMSQVRDRTGLSVSVTDFTRDPTFAELVRLAERERSASASHDVRVVTLQDEGPGRALFLVADAAGNALSYRALTGLLAGERRAYGLEPARATAGNSTVEDIAASHLEAMLRTQETGPYLLGGWSFGAVIAHEMARELVARGERVELLVSFDGVLPDRTPRVPGLALLGGRIWLAAATRLRVGAAGRQARRDPGLRDLIAAKSRIVARYQPGPVDCPAVLFKTGLNPRSAARLRSRLAAIYRPDARVLPAAGDHWSMLTQPNVADLARRLREALDGKTASPSNR